MKCFFPFRDKFKCRKGRSSPELQTQNRNSENSAANRVIKSSGSGSVSSPRSIPQLYKEKEHNLRVFTFAELRTATNNFNKLLRIGEGGFGSVYKGSIRPPNGEADPTVVAIKKLNKNGSQVLLFLFSSNSQYEIHLLCISFCLFQCIIGKIIIFSSCTHLV